MFNQETIPWLDPGSKVLDLPAWGPNLISKTPHFKKKKPHVVMQIYNPIMGRHKEVNPWNSLWSANLQWSGWEILCTSMGKARKSLESGIPCLREVYILQRNSFKGKDKHQGDLCSSERNCLRKCSPGPAHWGWCIYSPRGSRLHLELI